MGLFDVAGRNYTPVAIASVFDSFLKGRKQEQDEQYGRGQQADANRLKWYAAKNENDYRMGALGQQKYDTDSAQKTSQMNARFGLVNNVLNSLPALGHQFAPDTVGKVTNLVMTAPWEDIVSGKLDMSPIFGNGPQSPNPGGPTAPRPFKSMADYAAMPGPGADGNQGAPDGLARYANMGTPQEQTPGGRLQSYASAPTPQGVPSGGAFAPSPQVQSETGLTNAQIGETNASTAGIRQKTKLTDMATQSYPDFVKAVSTQPITQQRQAVDNWNRTHETNFLMPGMKRPDGSVQPFYKPDQITQSGIDDTTSQEALRAAEAYRANEEAGQVAPNAASDRTYKNRAGEADLTRAGADVMNAKTARGALLAKAALSKDPYVASQYTRLNAITRAIEAENANKTAAFGNVNITDHPAVIKGIDARINQLQGQADALEGDIKKRLTPKAGGPVVPGATPGYGINPGPLPDLGPDPYKGMSAADRWAALRAQQGIK